MTGGYVYSIQPICRYTHHVYFMLSYDLPSQNAPSKWHTYTTQNHGNLYSNDTLVEKRN